jgi:hypothetical protein
MAFADAGLLQVIADLASDQLGIAVQRIEGQAGQQGSLNLQ